MQNTEVQSKYTILGGTVFSALPSLAAEDFVTTGVMALFGTLVSYLASLVLKRIHRFLIARFSLKRKRKGM